MEVIDQLKKELKAGDFIIGTKEVLKALRANKLKKIYHAQNLSDGIRKDITYYVKLLDIELIEVPIPSDELGVVCKKPFAVSVLGMK